MFYPTYILFNVMVCCTLYPTVLFIFDIISHQSIMASIHDLYTECVNIFTFSLQLKRRLVNILIYAKLYFKCWPSRNRISEQLCLFIAPQKLTESVRMNRFGLGL